MAAIWNFQKKIIVLLQNNILCSYKIIQNNVIIIYRKFGGFLKWNKNMSKKDIFTHFLFTHIETRADNLYNNAITLFLQVFFPQILHDVLEYV